MKRLLLLRHAKSSWKNAALSDFDRPLNRRGRKAAPTMGAYLAAEGLRPDRVLCSAALRAEETWDRLKPRLDGEVPVKTFRSLYLASPARLLEVVQRQPNDLACLLVIGHNPGIANLARRLAGPGSSAEALARLAGNFPTAGLAELTFEGRSWSDIAPGLAGLVRIVAPKELAAAEG